jgi:hypothetical protein
MTSDNALGASRRLLEPTVVIMMEVTDSGCHWQWQCGTTVVTAGRNGTRIQWAVTFSAVEASPPQLSVSTAANARTAGSRRKHAMHDSVETGTSLPRAEPGAHRGAIR